SPDETQPFSRNQKDSTSIQDPQLLFYSGYIDPDPERFLYPFAVLSGGVAEGHATRYPKYEYPHDEL
ncbi:hypothetical protein GYMLUDRAFT_179489, partial [Collybiopsis luxurians FD-317 M1]